MYKQWHSQWKVLGNPPVPLGCKTGYNFKQRKKIRKASPTISRVKMLVSEWRSARGLQDNIAQLMRNTVPVECHEEHEVSFSHLHLYWEQKLCQVKAGFHWQRSQSRNQKCRSKQSSENSVLIPLTTPSFRLSESQAEAAKLGQSQSMGTCVVIGLFFRFCLGLRQSGLHWIVRTKSWAKLEEK